MSILERTTLAVTEAAEVIAQADPDQQWLRATKRPPVKPAVRLVGVDLFAGCGGMTLGFWEAARRFGVYLEAALAVEASRDIGSVYSRNFGGRMLTGDVGRLFNGEIGQAPTGREQTVISAVGDIAFLLGGPPCQGHSDLNNHTRRADPKNALYLKMARAAEVLKPDVVVIENVPPVQWDNANVVPTTEAALRSVGYRTAGAVINSVSVGVPQRRKRFILIGSRVKAIDPLTVVNRAATYATPPRSVRWAIADLVDVSSKEALHEMDRPSRVSAKNTERIRYLDDHGVENLPNSERPKCHRDDPEHSYKSMYGRLSWDAPAQTITTGFTSMGQGRFVHPSQSRTLTPHEAARLQTFPDWFDWGESSRGLLSTMIGNAVPAFLGMDLGLAIIPRLIDKGGKTNEDT